MRALVDSGARPRSVTHIVASTCDAATKRLIGLAMSELGPAPVPFVWVAMGSQVRQEQTLVSDQDSGIIYQSPQERAEAVAAYLLSLGQRVCAGLDRAGYAYCRGQVMASQPTWCRPAVMRWWQPTTSSCSCD